MNIQESDTRRRVLHAAGPIFAEKGFAGATVREICQAADVNLASVNYHFGDKETLYLETVRRAHALRTQQVPRREDLDDEDPSQRLRAFLETLLSRMLGKNAEGWESQLMMREVLHPTAACRDMVESYFRPQLDELRDLLREMLPNASQVQLTQAAFSIIGQCLFYRIAGDIAAMLASGQSPAHYELDSLIEHIYTFSLSAIDGLGGAGKKPGKRGSLAAR